MAEVPTTLETQLKKIQTQTANLFKQIQQEGVTKDGQVIIPAGSLKDVPGLTNY
jgi:hypothetical protein